MTCCHNAISLYTTLLFTPKGFTELTRSNPFVCTIIYTIVLLLYLIFCRSSVYTASECMHILSKLSHLIGAVSYPNGNARSSLTCVPVPSSFPTHSAQFLTLFWHDHWLIVEANVPLNDFCTAARIHPSPRIKIFMCPRKSFPNFTCRVMLAHLQTI